ncbi:hypothetical protein FKM82_022045 [Ascaphus truei]
MVPFVRSALVLVSIYLAIQCGYTYDPLFPSSKYHEWKKLILTHHWPVTVCKMDGVHCKSPPKYWTLHGLWTDKTQMCNNSWHFNCTEIQGILSEMNQWWPDVLHPNQSQLWSHEWQKHGTCAASLECLNSQLKYFSKGLELYKKVDLNSVLEKSGIKPSTTYYQMKDIEDAIIHVYGVLPKIQCLSPQQGEKAQTLGQIEICFTKEFQLRNCTNEELYVTPKEPPTKWNSKNEDLHVCNNNLSTYYPPVEEF